MLIFCDIVVAILKMATSFSGEGSRREPLTMCKQLVNFITCGYGT
jgi:hypothetical protein